MPDLPISPPGNLHIAAEEILSCTLSWLRQNYFNFQFYAERDIVWTIQQQFVQLVRDRRLNLKVFTDYPIMFNDKRARVDLALIDDNNSIVLALEFKYEPSHRRKDILPTKFPVVFWAEVKKDIERIHHFVDVGKAQAAYSILIDEGGYFRNQLIITDHSSWIDWYDVAGSQYPVALLLSKATCTGTSTSRIAYDHSNRLENITR